MKNVRELFERWMRGLKDLPLDQLSMSPDEVFIKLRPAGTQREKDMFASLWQSRLEVINPMSNPTQLPRTPGWYVVTSGFVRAFLGSIAPADSVSAKIAMVEVVVDDWNERITEDPKAERDLVPVLAHFQWNPHQPGNLWVDRISATDFVDVIVLQPCGDFWALTDRRTAHEPPFVIHLPGPGTLPFQRAAALINSRFEFGCYYSALLLEWVFAAGETDALKVADDFFNRRSGARTRRVSYTTARKYIRRARGL